MVVCRPRLSDARTAPVPWVTDCVSVLVSVDLPAPEDPEQHRGLTSPEIGRKTSNRGGICRIHGAPLDARRQTPCERVQMDVHVRAQIRFGQNHHRQNARRFRQCDISLEPPQIEIAVKSHHQECAVDVRDERLSGTRRVDAVELRVRRETAADPPLAAGLRSGGGENPSRRQRSG